jgi:hypothetical protein
MSHVIIDPPITKSLQRFAARVWDDPDTRSSAIGIAGVILVYLLLFLLGPRLLRTPPAPTFVTRPRTRQFSIEITPEMFKQPPKPQPRPQPKQFVETNPDAPENIPDKTNNFAAQNQQAAQEKPSPDSFSERPAMEGKKDFQSNQIVSGQLRQPTEHVPVSPPAPETSVTPSTAPRAEQNPLTGFDKKQGDNANAFGTNLAQNPANARPIPERIDGAKDVPLVEGATGLQPAIDPKRPRPRPSIVKTQSVRPAILAENKVGTRNAGVTAINAKFNQYGLYLQRMADAVQLEFDRVVGEARTYPPAGSSVTVRFILDSQGRIARFVEVDNHSSDLGAQMCTASISNRAPYGEWTEDMKATLNPDGEELVFTFYYE